MSEQPKGTMNLGFVKAIHSGVNPPINKKMLWFDDNIGKHKYFNFQTETWELLVGGTNPGSGASAIFNEAFVVSQPGNPNGVNGLNVTEGMLIEDFLRTVFKQANTVIYYPPTAGITSPVSIYNIEAGTTLENLIINGVFNRNDAGQMTAERLFKNGVLVANSNSFSENLKVTLSPTAYKYQVDYNQGDVKNDNLGNPHPEGQIIAGTITTGDLIFRGVLKRFFGPAIPNLTDFRNNLSNVLDNTSNTFILNTGTTHKDFYILIPSSREVIEIKDLDALSAVITNSFTKSIVIVNDIGGDAHEYELYKMSNAVAYSTPHRFQITIN